MTNVVIKPKTAHVNMTGTAFMVYANRYREAAVALTSTTRTKNGFDPAVYFLFCLSLELHLKSFIWLHDRTGKEIIKNKYRHNIEKLWRHSKIRGIGKYAQPTTLRDHVITLVGPCYRKRQFNYLDLEMVFSGYKNLKAEPKILPTLNPGYMLAGVDGCGPDHRRRHLLQGRLRCRVCHGAAGATPHDRADRRGDEGLARKEMS